MLINREDNRLQHYTSPDSAEFLQEMLMFVRSFQDFMVSYIKIHCLQSLIESL